MKRIIYLLMCVALFLSACVQAPVFKEEGYAHIKSNYPIVSVNGVEVEPSYTLDIAAEENTLVIVYHTYRHNYYCSFTWTAEANTAYEVTDQENKYPLTLFRWVRSNALWAARLDPIDPLKCIPEQVQ